MSSKILVKTAYGEQELTNVSLCFVGDVLKVERHGEPVLWASMPWVVVFG